MLKIHIVYNFTDAPFGGSNQFLKALKNYFIQQNVYSEQIEQADIVILNSHLFGQGKTLFGIIWANRRLFQQKTILHRVDGPVSLYQANNRFSIDKYVFKINRFVADGTIFQSDWSQKKCKEVGMPTKAFELVTFNAPDPAIFFPSIMETPQPGAKFKIIATSWSTNPNKGFDIYEFLDKHLDFDKYEMTFVGRSPIAFKNIQLIDPLPSPQVAEQLRAHHLFISASFLEACSNSLLEAIHCGCVPIARDTSSHPEMIEKFGILFQDSSDILQAIDMAAKQYQDLKANLTLPTLEEIGARYYQFCQKVHQGRQQEQRPLTFSKALSFKFDSLRFQLEQRLGQIDAKVSK